MKTVAEELTCALSKLLVQLMVAREEEGREEFLFHQHITLQTYHGSKNLADYLTKFAAIASPLQ